MPEMTTQELATYLIACLEGCRLTAFQDPGGVWSIGFSHTGPAVVEGLVWNYVQAVTQLQDDIAPLLLLVVSLPVPHGAALVSFGYNCGRGALELVLAGHDTIGNPRHYTDRHGNVLTALQSRRRLEEALMLL
jgi:GH24 family phage-related lysozyme (muramidase)